MKLREGFFLVLISLVLSGGYSFAKPFKRALVISGGGMVPGLALGYLAGAEEVGWKPDVIIVTCGASVGTVFYDQMKDVQASLEYMKSEEFFRAVHRVRVSTSNLLTLQSKFSGLEKHPDLVPDFFRNNALFAPTYFLPMVSNGYFINDNQKPRVVVLSARAHFHRQDVGLPKVERMKYSQVFMTDKDTATYLTDYKSALAAKYPQGYIEEKTEVMTYMPASIALRATIADPFLLDPLMYGTDYYFTGASDLYPIEVAHFLADEVVATYPMAMFSEYEELAFKSAFGISQIDRASSIIKDQTIAWIDQTEFPKEISFDPVPQPYLVLKSGIPNDFETYQEKIDRQYEFGKTRMKEALLIKQNQGTYNRPIRVPFGKSKSKKKNGVGLSNAL